MKGPVRLNVAAGVDCPYKCSLIDPFTKPYLDSSKLSQSDLYSKHPTGGFFSTIKYFLHAYRLKQQHFSRSSQGL